ncbi:MAG: hypothetical protein PHP31_07000 [Lentimicrobiaceae bacterium]|nr:hypothetical protein [Lentimicrobiaceae bacterium]
MEESSKIYYKASLMTWLSYIAIVLSLISFEVEHIRAGKNWIMEIPEWIVFSLWNFALAGIFLLLKQYIQKYYHKKLTLLNVSALIYLMLVPLNIIAEIHSNDGLMIISILLTLVIPILFLISGIQVLEVGKKRTIGTLIITYALLIMVSILLSLYFALKGQVPLWFYIVGTSVDIVYLTILSMNFREMSHAIRKSRITARYVLN